ncbi:kdo(2)-lipid A phosphoethanolamine 7''-transferase [Photorhabdus temperata]|uniref:Putative membrane-associated, metal-dependent hydrolase n=1 Tax=Photorhabdus temperata subsp. temperata Meg1 TaxID=1393735 RepID=A0A081RUI1_PHOTE|nr:kdo(2)-lipid A phosphoethanolamine 7''-transferase [Photorhabdus temperata]KER02334.1 putative membrane-associated, metal-dependent hydrolase [Photorhabdus temperata subsp. temperata Meg1]MCT8348708.1 kdo(2)-lipid A phosphoethanolamine 7''-transferase [Photorhabdus temperata]
MKKIKSLPHPIQALLLAIYIGIFLNLSVFYRHFEETHTGIHTSKLVTGSIKAFTIVLFTFFLLRLLSLGGRWFYRITASLLVLFSVAASYYMTFFNVVIGYGIIASVLTTDIDLSVEVIGYNFIIWLILLSILPLLLIWSGNLHNTLLEQLRTPGQRIKSLAVMLMAALLVWVPLDWMNTQQKANDALNNIDMPSYGGVVAHSYLPSNWLTALGLYITTATDEYLNQNELFDPTQKFTYVAPQGINDTYVIFIIGETARWDHMGILGYERDTTPLLSKEPNLVAFRGESCDTATKLSLRCMFVREGGTKNNDQRTLKEQNIFSVMHKLGFSSELFSMQSEVWFYNKTEVDNFAFRELIASESRNDGKPVDDMMLINELKESLEHHPNGKHLVILHTKGSHYLYSQRYPRSFAKYQPECMNVDDDCSKEQLINAFDNSILYTDYFIKNVIDQVRDKKALVFYTSDHGESIDDDSHLHGTPRHIAPPEQFRVPLIVWASDKFMAAPNNAQAFENLRTQAKTGNIYRHVELYDTILGCLGYTSPDGGMMTSNNLCGD